MTTQHYIFLENVRFYSYHGVAPQETAIGNEFIINLRQTSAKRPKPMKWKIP